VLRAPHTARLASRRQLVHDARVYVSLSRLQVDEARSDELVAAFRRRAGLVESHSGFIDLQVWRSDRDPSEVIMVSRWQDKESFRAYMRSDDHRTSHERINPSLEESIDLQRLEQLHTYDVVAE
jgi:heme-degrading monooxygenase HmoA